jgi:hypothetical protein
MMGEAAPCENETVHTEDDTVKSVRAIKKCMGCIFQAARDPEPPPAWVVLQGGQELQAGEGQVW